MSEDLFYIRAWLGRKCGELSDENCELGQTSNQTANLLQEVGGMRSVSFLMNTIGQFTIERWPWGEKYNTNIYITQNDKEKQN